jgi:threonine/homoserine/homoserine lactone efflux protein
MVIEIEYRGIRISLSQLAIGVTVVALVGAACLAWLIVHAFSRRRDR